MQQAREKPTAFPGGQRKIKSGERTNDPCLQDHGKICLREGALSGKIANDALNDWREPSPGLSSRPTRV